MKKIFEALDNGERGTSVLIELNRLQEFTEYSMSQSDLYSFRYEYFAEMVKITITDKHIIQRHERKRD